jgi:hypothetical protein
MMSGWLTGRRVLGGRVLGRRVLGRRVLGRRVIGCALAAALGALLLPIEGAAAGPQSAYFRIAVSPECTIYGLVWDDMLFLANDPDELADAQPIRARALETATGGVYPFPESVLPVPAEVLPRASIRAKASLNYVFGTHRFEHPEAGQEFRRVSARLGWEEEDESGVWEYWIRVVSDVGTRPQTAPVLAVPPMGPLALEVSTQAVETDKIGIGVQVMAGETELQQVTRDGENAPIRLRVFDASGEEVTAADGDLEKFGFTRGGKPCYSVRVAEPGTYTVVVEMNAGPLAPQLRAEAEFTVR